MWPTVSLQWQNNTEMSDQGPVDAIGVALLVASALEDVGCSYFIGGSVASSLQGEPRSTNDIDIVIDMPLEKVPAFHAALGKDFALDEDMLRDAIRRATCANMFYLPSVTKVDLFARGRSEYDRVEFSRREPLAIRNAQSLVVKAVEDTILRKLLWYREGGGVSDRQWRDISSVLRVSADRLDLDYLNKWAAKLGLVELLTRVRGDV